MFFPRIIPGWTFQQDAEEGLKDDAVGENKPAPTFTMYGRFVSRFLIKEWTSRTMVPRRAMHARGKESAGNRARTEIYFPRDRFTRYGGRGQGKISPAAARTRCDLSVPLPKQTTNLWIFLLFFFVPPRKSVTLPLAITVTGRANSISIEEVSLNLIYIDYIGI